jgi:hypothetical protein
MSEIPQEQLATRAFGGLFMANRPRLRELATDVLRLQVITQGGVREYGGTGTDPFGGCRLVQLRPTGRIVPDLVLHDQGGTHARAIFEVKLHARAQASMCTTCEGIGRADGRGPKEVQEAYDAEDIAESAPGVPGVWRSMHTSAGDGGTDSRFPATADSLKSSPMKQCSFCSASTHHPQ